ncbi:AAA family ATPase [Aciduricibacillus chroicocephali]|uniref:AAA family ATPase n=1 Tax=Aciduricibacillus chroicocephali TaxID=3054939 RepID=A0ABY9KXG9_9BACI|nr:AAA family ATPase [Bacillaceae bacterium 44XB]
MYIKSMKAQNFRSLKNVKIEFKPGFNLIIGKNNTGKSNILKLLQRIFVDDCKFSQSDYSKINNTNQMAPEFVIETSQGNYMKNNEAYYAGSKVSFNDFLNKLGDWHLIFIDIQKEYSDFIKLVFEEYNNLDKNSKTILDTQINIDFSEVMGMGNSIYFKEDSIYVIDEYADTSELENKSTGVQRVALLICLINLFKIKKKISHYILLIDEPEGNLHVKSQKKMLELLKSFSEDHQVIISSHSTIFMKDLDLDAVNYIDRDKNTGSYVDNKNLGLENFKKIRDVLGLDLSDTLFLNKNIVAVEGMSEVILHSYIYDRLNKNKSDFTFYTIEGADNALQNIIALKQVLNKDLIIILDNDSKGIKIAEDIRKNTFVNKSRIFMQPNDTIKGELEDLFPKDFIKIVISKFIELQRSVITKNLGENAEEKLNGYIGKIESFDKFSEVERIGEGDSSYIFKGQSFVKFIKRNLEELNDEDFHSTVKEFELLYDQF